MYDSIRISSDQGQQFDTGCWLPEDSGMMLCLAGSTLHDKALEARYQCAYIAEQAYGYGTGTTMAMRSYFGAEMRQSTECLPFTELPVTMHDENSPYWGDAMKDCVLDTMGFVDPKGGVRHKKIKEALDSILLPSVMENFSYGNTTKEKWDFCFENGYKKHAMEMAYDQCGDVYTEAEAKQIQYYGARTDAFLCLTQLNSACKTSFENSMTDAYYAALGYGTGYGTGSGTVNVRSLF